MTIFEHIMMQIDRHLLTISDDGVEMETIRETTDDVELITTRIPGIDTRRCTSLGITVGDALQLINIRCGRVLCCRILWLSLGRT